MKLRITGQGPELGQEPQQAEQPAEPAGKTYDATELSKHLNERHARVEQGGAPDPAPASQWTRDPNNGKWSDPHAGAPAQAQAPAADTASPLERYRAAVREAMQVYGDEATAHKAHAASRATHPDARPDERNEASKRIEDSRLSNIQSAVGQINALTLRPIPPAMERDFRDKIDARLENVMQLSASGLRPDLETIRNHGDIRPRQGHQELSKDEQGLYRLNDPQTPGDRQLANNSYVFVIPVSNPSQVWIGDRATGGHTAISRGVDVYYAGEITFEQGRLTSWSNDSGHYTPNADLHRQIGSSSIAALESLLPRDKFRPYQG